MTKKYYCDLCGIEIIGIDKRYTLTLEIPDFQEPEQLGDYCPTCSDKITDAIKKLKASFTQQEKEQP